MDEQALIQALKDLVEEMRKQSGSVGRGASRRTTQTGRTAPSSSNPLDKMEKSINKASDAAETMSKASKKASNDLTKNITSAGAYFQSKSRATADEMLKSGQKVSAGFKDLASTSKDAAKATQESTEATKESTKNEKELARQRKQVANSMLNLSRSLVDGSASVDGTLKSVGSFGGSLVGLGGRLGMLGKALSRLSMGAGFVYGALKTMADSAKEVGGTINLQGVSAGTIQVQKLMSGLGQEFNKVINESANSFKLFGDTSDEAIKNVADMSRALRFGSKELSDNMKKAMSAQDLQNFDRASKAVRALGMTQREQAELQASIMAQERYGARNSIDLQRRVAERFRQTAENARGLADQFNVSGKALADSAKKFASSVLGAAAARRDLGGIAGAIQQSLSTVLPDMDEKLKGQISLLMSQGQTGAAAALVAQQGGPDSALQARAILALGDQVSRGVTNSADMIRGAAPQFLEIANSIGDTPAAFGGVMTKFQLENIAALAKENKQDNQTQKGLFGGRKESEGDVIDSQESVALALDKLKSAVYAGIGATVANTGALGTLTIALISMGATLLPVKGMLSALKAIPGKIGSIFKSGSGLFGKLLGDLKGAPGKIGSVFGGMLGALKAIPEKIGSVFGGMIGKLGGVFGGMIGALKAIPGKLGGVFKSGAELFKGMLGKIASVAAGGAKVAGVAGAAASGAKVAGAAGAAGAAAGASKASKLLGGAAKAGGVAMRALGKVALPLTAALAAFDGFKGFTADKDAGVGSSLLNAGSSILNGLTFGLLGSSPEEIAKKAEEKKAEEAGARPLDIKKGFGNPILRVLQIIGQTLQEQTPILRGIFDNTTTMINLLGGKTDDQKMKETVDGAMKAMGLESKATDNFSEKNMKDRARNALMDQYKADKFDGKTPKTASELLSATKDEIKAIAGTVTDKEAKATGMNSKFAMENVDSALKKQIAIDTKAKPDSGPITLLDFIKEISKTLTSILQTINNGIKIIGNIPAPEKEGLMSKFIKGAASGGLLGAGIGSMVPGVGTLMGGAAGALAGGAGALLSDLIGQMFGAGSSSPSGSSGSWLSGLGKSISANPTDPKSVSLNFSGTKIAGKPVWADKDLTKEQMGIMGMSMSMGNKYDEWLMKKYQAQKAGKSFDATGMPGTSAMSLTVDGKTQQLKGPEAYEYMQEQKKPKSFMQKAWSFLFGPKSKKDQLLEYQQFAKPGAEVKSPKTDMWADGLVNIFDKPKTSADTNESNANLGVAAKEMLNKGTNSDVGILKEIHRVLVDQSTDLQAIRSNTQRELQGYTKFGN